MRSSRSSSDASLRSNADSIRSTPEAVDNLSIFVKLLSGEGALPSSSFFSLCRHPTLTVIASHPPFHSLLNHHNHSSPTALPAHLPPAVLSPPRPRGETPHHPLFRQLNSLLPQHFSSLRYRHHPTFARRHATQEDPLYPQRLQGAGAAHSRGLQLLQWALLWQTSHAGGSQMHRARGLQEGESRAQCG